MDDKLYTKFCNQAMSVGRWTETMIEMNVVIGYAIDASRRRRRVCSLIEYVSWP